MTRCPEFYAKLLKDGNFCGLSEGAISQIKGYLELVDKIASRGIPKERVMERFPEGAARPLLSLKDDETRTKGLNYVVGRLMAGEKITAGDLKSSIKVWLGTGKCNVEKHDGNPGHVSKKFTNVNSPTEEKPDPAGKPLSEVLGKEPDQPAAPVQESTENVEKPAPGPQMEFPGAWSPEVCKTGPCPDGKSHNTRDKVRGVCCDLTDQPINQISACPYLERQKRATAQAASVPAALQARPITNERPPVNVIPVQLTKAEAEVAITSIIRGYFTPKSREQWEQVKKAGKWDTDLEALEGLRDDAAERIA